MYVCLCVCLSVCLRGYLRNHLRNLYHFLMRVAYDCGSVLLREGDEIRRGRGSFGGFLPYWQCIVQHSIWDPYKNGNRSRCRWLLRGVTIPEGKVRSFVRYCGQGSSLLWTPALRPFMSVQCATPGRGGELVGVCGVCASCVGWRKG